MQILTILLLLPVLEKEQEFEVFSAVSLSLDSNILLLNMRGPCLAKIKIENVTFLFRNVQYTCIMTNGRSS